MTQNHSTSDTEPLTPDNFRPTDYLAGHGGSSPHGESVYTLRYGMCCHVGTVREHNEDRGFVDGRSEIFLVADGMGGHFGGQQASQMVVDLLPRKLQPLVEQAEVDVQLATSIVQRAVLRVNDAMQDYARQNPEFDQMGSTVALAVRRPRHMLISHIGDSRVYLCREGLLRQLTTDHTYVQLLVESGAISPEQAQTHRMRNVLLNSLGARDIDQLPEVCSVQLMGGDKFLLCTDGLNDSLSEREIAEILTGEGTPQETADRLLVAALRNGARDNVTAIVIDVTREARRTRRVAH